MHRNIKVALGGAALSIGVVVGLPSMAAAAPANCVTDEYSQVCQPLPEVIDEGVTAPGSGGSTGGAGNSGGSSGGGTVSAGRGAVASLPFTGDEILVLSLAGAAALAAGTALTVAGRRRGAITA